MSAYKQSTKDAHSYLLIDLKQSTNDMYRLRSNVDPRKTQIFLSEKIDVEDVYKGERDLIGHFD